MKLNCSCKRQQAVSSLYIVIATMVFSDMLGNTTFLHYRSSIVYDCFLIIEILGGCYGLMLQSWNKKKIAFVFLFIGIGVCIYFAGGRTTFLLTILLLFQMETADFEKLIRFIFVERLLVFLVIVALSVLGVLGGAEALFEGSNSAQKGATLGFVHANSFSAEVITLLFLYISIRRKNINIMDVVLIVLVEMLNYFISRSRCGLILFFVFIVGLVAFKVIKEDHILRISQYVLFCIIFVNFGLIIVRTFCSLDMVIQLDEMLFNSRMGLAGEYLKTYSVSIFGEVLDLKIIAQKIPYYALDNGYTILLLHYGVTGFGVFVFILQNVMRYLKQKKEKVLMILALCYMIWMIYEGYSLSATGNFLLLLFAKSIPVGISDRGDMQSINA